MHKFITYENRRDTIITHAWEIWTKNGLGLDREDWNESERVVRDAVNDCYYDGIEDIAWLAATLKRLGQEVDWPRPKPAEDEA